jgi:hypothetical protein
MNLETDLAYREEDIMKITKAEGYKKPNYAVAVAAAMVAVTVSGCGAGPDLEGATVLNMSPSEREVELSGDVSVAAPNNNVIDYDGGLVMYTEPDDVVELAGDVPEYLVDDNEDEDDITEADESEEDASAYYEPDLVLEGGAPIEEP